MNKLLQGELNIGFYCGNYTAANVNVTFDSEEKHKKNELEFYVIKNGEIAKNKTLSFLSKSFVAHMLNEFDLTRYLEKKFSSKKFFFNNFLEKLVSYCKHWIVFFFVLENELN